MKKNVEKKTKKFPLGMLTAIFMLIADVLYIALDGADRTFSMLAFGLILAGVLVQFLSGVLPKKIAFAMPIVSVACYGVGFAQCLSLGLETLSDVWNQVTFVGGNATMAVLFIALFFVGTFTSIVASFTQGE